LFPKKTIEEKGKKESKKEGRNTKEIGREARLKEQTKPRVYFTPRTLIAQTLYQSKLEQKRKEEGKKKR